MRNTLVSARGYVYERFWAAPVVTLAQAVFIAAVVVLSVAFRMSWRPDNFFLLAAFFFFVTGKGRAFVKDWFPFVLLLISYDALRGFADNLNSRVIGSEVVALERALFGSLPTVELQRLWTLIGNPRWVLVVAIALYSAHFFIPLIVGLWLWLRHREHFGAFAASFLVLSYMAFITFLLMPVMPPWMAMAQGYIHGEYLGVAKPLEATRILALPTFGIEALPSIYRGISPNPVAAIPSLHAAYAWLAFLWVRRLVGAPALFLAAYPLAVWLALVFLADHYVVDILVGLAYTHIVYFFVVTRKRRIGSKRIAGTVAVPTEAEELSPR